MADSAHITSSLRRSAGTKHSARQHTRPTAAPRDAETTLPFYTCIATLRFTYDVGVDFNRIRVSPKETGHVNEEGQNGCD
jgi:hypothetical protein